MSSSQEVRGLRAGPTAGKATTAVVPPTAFALVSLAALAAAGVAGCKGAAKAETKGQSAAVEVPVKVATTTVGERPMPRQVPLTGNLEPDRKTDLAANTAGRVVKTFVERGQRITEGAVVAQVDVRLASLARSEAQAHAASARVQREQAEKECKRYEELLKGGAISQAEYDRASSQCRTQASSVEAAEARALQANQTVGDGTIRAPFTGTVAERFVSVGDYVRPDSKVATLLVADPLRLKLTVPEAQVALVRPGRTVEFRLAALPGRSFQGTVKFIGGEIRTGTRDLLVEAVVPNADGVLLPGMFVTAFLNAGDVTLPVVPASALTGSPDSRSVYVVDGPRLKQRIVQPGVEKDGFVAVEFGLKKGEVIVDHPSPQVVDGALLDSSAR